MANLIITVISIALVAVAALMGAYYGGSAFMDGQAKARNNKVVNIMGQTEVAYNLCVAQEPKGRDDDGPCGLNDYGNGDLKTKKYLSAEPLSQICDNTSFGCEEYGYGAAPDVTNYLSAPGIYISLFGAGDVGDGIAKNNLELCKFIAKKAGGETAVPRQFNGYIPSSGPVYKMDCTWADGDGDNVLTTNDYFRIYYKF